MALELKNKMKLVKLKNYIVENKHSMAITFFLIYKVFGLASQKCNCKSFLKIKLLTKQTIAVGSLLYIKLKIKRIKRLKNLRSLKVKKKNLIIPHFKLKETTLSSKLLIKLRFHGYCCESGISLFQ